MPADVKSSGTLTVAADATYAPDEFIASDGKTVIGMDADMAKAIAELMGLKASVQNIPFDSIIPGLAAGKYDLGMSSFTDTKDREKTVDFVTYASGGHVVLRRRRAAARTSPRSTTSAATRSVRRRGRPRPMTRPRRARSAPAAGKPGVSVSVFPDQNGVNLALSSGRVDVAMADTPVGRVRGQAVGRQVQALRQLLRERSLRDRDAKDSGLQQPVLAAVKALMADGTYKKILDYWVVSERRDQQPDDQRSDQLAGREAGGSQPRRSKQRR